MILKHRMLLLLPLAVLSVALAARSFAEEPATPPAACSAPEYRALDFKLGSFVVTGGGGHPAGESTVESLLGGCLLVEHWKGALGGLGRASHVIPEQCLAQHLAGRVEQNQTVLLAGNRDRRHIV